MLTALQRLQTKPASGMRSEMRGRRSDHLWSTPAVRVCEGGWVGLPRSIKGQGEGPGRSQVLIDLEPLDMGSPPVYAFIWGNGVGHRS
jgi:hypothetical protein